MLLLWQSPTAWSAFSDAGSVASLSADNQAILPGSFWTPVAVFTINDDRSIEDDDRPDPAVHLISVQVSFSGDPAAPANTPALRPGDIAAVALAREVRDRANRVYNPTGVNADPIQYIATMPTGENAGLSTTIYFDPPEERGDADADADADPSYTTNYILLVATSPQIRDSARFRTSFSISVDYLAPNTDTSFGPLNVFNVVNNVGDMRPVREGINASGIPTINQDVDPGERGYFPPFYPRRAASYPDARAVSSAGGRVPELWPAGSALKPILGLELAGGYPNALARLTGIDLELISIVRREEWLSDGIDNDGSGEIDEESTSRYQYENKLELQDIHTTDSEQLSFFVRDELVYQNENEFKSDEARQAYLQYLRMKARFTSLNAQLEADRLKFTGKDNPEQQELTSRILNAEWALLFLERDIPLKEYEIRRLELEKIDPLNY
jgi:hypothetical protein